MRILLALALCLSGYSLSAIAEDAVYELTIKDHKFEPAELKVPVGKPFTLHITNQDAQAEEFDSDDLHAEKVIAPNADGTVHVSALDAGSYKFSGEYHEDTAKGVVTAQ